jgi:hypothetical protein
MPVAACYSSTGSNRNPQTDGRSQIAVRQPDFLQSGYRSVPDVLRLVNDLHRQFAGSCA